MAKEGRKTGKTKTIVFTATSRVNDRDR
ncbi:uncharacterized protein G2W53_036725 [Senna tora]|uniref:Uncharacterized protein n=1 Tax=Senna tora TaxID=362788 RepID=A0A834SUJ1_9FABA|nr:uncharacterized protein G2W53_036725 [Senna tora]